MDFVKLSKNDVNFILNYSMEYYNSHNTNKISADDINIIYNQIIKLNSELLFQKNITTCALERYKNETPDELKLLIKNNNHSVISRLIFYKDNFKYSTLFKSVGIHQEHLGICKICNYFYRAPYYKKTDGYIKIIDGLLYNINSKKYVIVDEEIFCCNYFENLSGIKCDDYINYILNNIQQYYNIRANKPKILHFEDEFIAVKIDNNIVMIFLNTAINEYNSKKYLQRAMINDNYVLLTGPYQIQKFIFDKFIKELHYNQ